LVEAGYVNMSLKFSIRFLEEGNNVTGIGPKCFDRKARRKETTWETKA
jgi:hypothetical protein